MKSIRYSSIEEKKNTYIRDMKLQRQKPHSIYSTTTSTLTLKCYECNWQWTTYSGRLHKYTCPMCNTTSYGEEQL